MKEWIKTYWPVVFVLIVFVGCFGYLKIVSLPVKVDTPKQTVTDPNWLQQLEVRKKVILKDIDALKNRPTVKSVAPKVIPGVVHIMCPSWQGSGFVVGNRLIATARHVVDGVTDFTITTNDGHKLHATRAISFKEHDIGFIWIDDLHCVSEKSVELECKKLNHEVKLHVLDIGSIKDCSIGQPVFAIGSPYGQANFNFLSSGIISSMNPKWDEGGRDYGWEIGWTTTVVGHPGNSGCPIFTMDGKVRGVLVGGYSPVLILAMPVDLFQDHLDEITLMFEMDMFRKETQSVEYLPMAVYQCH